MKEKEVSKRKPDGQPGNQNARTHRFYRAGKARTLTLTLILSRQGRGDNPRLPRPPTAASQ